MKVKVEVEFGGEASCTSAAPSGGDPSEAPSTNDSTTEQKLAATIPTENELVAEFQPIIRNSSELSRSSTQRSTTPGRAVGSENQSTKQSSQLHDAADRKTAIKPEIPTLRSESTSGGASSLEEIMEVVSSRIPSDVVMGGVATSGTTSTTVLPADAAPPSSSTSGASADKITTLQASSSVPMQGNDILEVRPSSTASAGEISERSTRTTVQPAAEESMQEEVRAATSIASAERSGRSTDDIISMYREQGEKVFSADPMSVVNSVKPTPQEESIMTKVVRGFRQPSQQEPASEEQSVRTRNSFDALAEEDDEERTSSLQSAEVAGAVVEVQNMQQEEAARVPLPKSNSTKYSSTSSEGGPAGKFPSGSIPSRPSTTTPSSSASRSSGSSGGGGPIGPGTLTNAHRRKSFLRKLAPETNTDGPYNAVAYQKAVKPNDTVLLPTNITSSDPGTTSSSSPAGTTSSSEETTSTSWKESSADTTSSSSSLKVEASSSSSRQIESDNSASSSGRRSESSSSSEKETSDSPPTKKQRVTQAHYSAEKQQQFGKVLLSLKDSNRFPAHGGPVGLDSDSSHNILPGSLAKMAAEFSHTGLVDSQNPVCFGTIAGNGDESDAPMATKRTHLHFRRTKDPQRRIYSAWFEVVMGGKVGNFPVLLGGPFLRDYRVNICHDAVPTYATFDGEDAELFPEADTAMLEIEFIPAGEVEISEIVPPMKPRTRKQQKERRSRYMLPARESKNSIYSFLTRQQTSQQAREHKTTFSKVRKATPSDDKYYDLNSTERCMVATSFMIMGGYYGAEPQKELRKEVDQVVAFATQGGGDDLNFGLDSIFGDSDEDAAGQGHENAHDDEEEESSSAEQDENSGIDISNMTEEQATAVLATEFPDLKPEELKWLHRQRRSLGHASSLQWLFKGRARTAMKRIRALCRKCRDQDNVNQIRERGGLLQFAKDKNRVWVIDSMKSALGRGVYLTDACTRLRVSELSDAARGGLTGAAVRAVVLMRLMSQGSPERIIFDEGTEFNNVLFTKVCASFNIRPHSIGLKAAHKISKIERMNGDHRRNIRKMVMEPYEEAVAVLIWARAARPILEETLSEALENMLATEADSSVNDIDMGLRRELNAEHMFQVNSTPVLGTSLTPFNLSSGGFFAGARDWEVLREELGGDEERDDELDMWMRAKAKLQNCVRRAIRDRDAQECLRRCEIVGRSYKRCVDLSLLHPGMTVQVRRNDQFRKNHEGEVVTVSTDGAHVRVGGATTKYDAHDIALITPDVVGVALETYPDNIIGEELEQRLSTAHDHPDGPLFADPTTSVQGTVRTTESGALGGTSMGHSCRFCGRLFTSRHRLQQHIALKHGDGGPICEPVPEEERPTMPVQFKEGLRQEIDFEDEDDEGDFDDDAPFRGAPRSSARPVVAAATVERDQWTETAEEITRWHVEPREQLFVPTRDNLPNCDYAKLTGERETTYIFLYEPDVERKFKDNWKRPGPQEVVDRRLAGEMQWVGCTRFRKAPSMFLKQFLLRPPTTVEMEGVSSPARSSVESSVFAPGVLLEQTAQVQEESENLNSAAASLVEEQIEEARKRQRSSRSSQGSEEEGQPKRIRTATASAYLAAKPRAQASDSIYIGPEERFFEGGYAHENLQRQLRGCVSTMELKCEGGRVYLTPADEEVALDAKERAYDFTVLPQITKRLGEQRRKHGRLLHLDPICYDFSQLLNGKVIKEKMNAANNKDIDYVVTAYELNTNRAFSPPQYQGNSILLRWGEETTPEFIPEDSSLWSTTKGDFTVARVYYEKTTTAHEKMQLCASEGKSGAVIIDEKTAERMGFESYYVPSVRAEVAAVVSHNIFGETKMRSEVKDKNIITSRLVVVIKVDLTTGEAKRVKSRWVSRGFEDRRFGKNQTTQLDCRSFTMSDSSFLMLLQFCQATDSGVWFGDVKEAFLKGMRFDEAYGDEYLKDKSSKVWMTVPKVIQGMEEFGLKELVELVKAIYGCKDAPLCWQRTFHNELRTLGFQQSLIDPCLWTVFATRKEVEVLKQGEEAVKQYFWEKVGEIEALPEHDNGKCREILCGQGDKQQQQLPLHTADDGFLNPASAEMTTSLTTHYKRPGVLLGALGSHVDDTISGGRLLFMLRILCLFRRLPLGSWTRLEPGSRDGFIGREVQCMPACFDQRRLSEMLTSRKSEIDNLGLEIDPLFRKEVQEKDLQEAEAKYNTTRTTEPTEYAKSPELKCTAQVLFDKHKMAEDVAYLVSQESYSSKIKEVTREEVETYFRERDMAKSKWQKKNVKNPFRGRVGELIWIVKTNAVVATTISEIAGELHAAERADSWESVQFFVSDLSALILLCKFSEASVRRVVKLGNLYEHTLFGCGDASRDRVGGTLNLAGPCTDRHATVSNFTKLPKRVFNSSTGIEILAQRLLMSELLFLYQLALDLHLINLDASVLQLVDSKNCTTEPKEKSLRVDYMALAQLREEGFLQIQHVPGKLNWSDALTKSVREVQIFLLYLSTVWGITDKKIVDVVKQFTEKQKAKFAKAAGEGEDEVEFSDDDDDVEEAVVPAGSHVAAPALLTAGAKRKDTVVEDDDTVTVVHYKPRQARLTPHRVGGIFEELLKENLLDKRTTEYKFVGEEIVKSEDDDWRRVPGGGHARIDGAREWTGKTTFYKKNGKHGPQLTKYYTKTEEKERSSDVSLTQGASSTRRHILNNASSTSLKCEPEVPKREFSWLSSPAPHNQRSGRSSPSSPTRRRTFGPSATQLMMEKNKSRDVGSAVRRNSGIRTFTVYPGNKGTVQDGKLNTIGEDFGKMCKINEHD